MSSSGKGPDDDRPTGHAALGNQWARKYHWNAKFFRSIESEKQAYWLGFLFGDGSVYCQGANYKVKLGVAMRDVEHLEQFSSDIEYTGSPSVYTDTRGFQYVELQLFGNDFARSVISLGMDPKGKASRVVPILPENPFL